MKAKIQWIKIVMVLISFFVIFAGLLYAQEQNREEIRQEFRERLKGSDGVFVYVEVIAQEKTDEKTFIEEIQEEVEDQLKDSKIKILTKDGSDITPGRPRLVISLVTYKEPSQKGIFLYSFRIVHYEISSMLRTNRYVEGICWDSGLYVGRDKTSSIKKTIRTQLQKYIDDYLAANPSL